MLDRPCPEKMYADLNVPWPVNLPVPRAVQQIESVLGFSETLGYDIVALNVSVGSAKEVKQVLSTSFTPEIFQSLVKKFPKLRLLRRVTVVLGDAQPNIAQLASVQLGSETVDFDIVAALPRTEKHLQTCATALDIDLIVLDTAGRLPYPLRHKLVGAAIGRGVRFEVCYGEVIGASQQLLQRHLIGNAAALFRVTRNRGVVLSSGTNSPAGLRAPLDIVNLVGLWGLPATTARDSVGKAALAAATQGVLRAKSVKQAIIVEEPKKKKQRVN